jgi:ABC-type siderophore export system fused ATPase/permease subunit
MRRPCWHERAIDKDFQHVVNGRKEMIIKTEQKHNRTYMVISSEGDVGGHEREGPA